MDSLIEQLRNFRDKTNDSEWSPVVYLKAADKIEELHAENAEMEKQLNEFSEFLCCMTGNLLSKTNYTAQAMIEAAEDYQQRVCDDCDKVKVIGNDELIDELQSVQDDLARVTEELADCREKNAGLALALLFECAPNPDVAEKPAIEDILKVVFQPGYDVVTIYNPPDEDGLCTMTATGVISKEEYEAALKARE